MGCIKRYRSFGAQIQDEDAGKHTAPGPSHLQKIPVAPRPTPLHDPAAKLVFGQLAAETELTLPLNATPICLCNIVGIG